MAYGLGRIDPFQAAESENGPTGALFFPIEGRPPALALNGRPTVGQPQLGAFVTSVGHETQPVAAAGRPVRDGVRVDDNAVARLLVVEGEARSIVADEPDAAGELDPVENGVRVSAVPDLAVIARVEGVQRQQALDVHQEELLVLLFVLDTELGQEGHLWLGRTSEQLAHGLVYLSAVRGHLARTRSR